MSTQPSPAKQIPVISTAHNAVPAPIPLPLHNLEHQIGLVREALRSEKRRLGFFLGAGCPLGIYDVAETKSLKHIPDVAGLTEVIAGKFSADKTQKDCWEKLTNACKSVNCPAPNVEHILTQLRTICALKGTATIDGMRIKDLHDLEGDICNEIVSIIGKSLPEHKNSYNRFAAWVRHLERVYPLEIFTPNYDLLLEEAFEQYKVPFFDGFVGSREPFFDLPSMEQDKIPERWVRLWKLHGSINWIKKGDDSVYRCYPPKSGQQVMIYPSHLKYEQSRRLPYLAMCDRLKAFFREVNPVIILCGYSFADEHLNELILDGLRGNRSAHCFSLMYSKLEDHKDAVNCAKKAANLTLLAWDGAVVTTREGSYLETQDFKEATGIGMKAETRTTSDNKESYIPKSLLGDFHHFCLFLETQLGNRTFL